MSRHRAEDLWVADTMNGSLKHSYRDDLLACSIFTMLALTLIEKIAALCMTASSKDSVSA
jgi:hypothetical protein